MTPRQQKALQALLTAPTKAEAARLAGIGESTLRSYLRDPAFAAAFQRESAALMRDATLRLRQSLTGAVNTLNRIVESADDSPAAQVQAARTLLDFSLRYSENADILDRLDKLEKWRNGNE